MELITCETSTIAGMTWPAPTTEDERFMLRALELAEMGRGGTSPNPMVGAVIVADGQVVGEGHHERAGEPHAEVHAIREAGSRARGATMYVTLEPCSHFGRTPPCAELLVGAELGRVIVAMSDPNPLVGGKGERLLRDAGITVDVGLYEELARRQNEAFIKWIVTGSPFVTLKMAMTMDGKVATRTGDSRWITSEDSRRDVHEARAHSDAVMVGIGTVMADDPQLTARDVGASKQPLRIIVDSLARTPLDKRVLETTEAPTVIAVSSEAPSEARMALESRGALLIEAGSGSRVDLRALLAELGAREITCVFAEGGPTLAASLLEGGLVDKLVFYIAPKIVGGREAQGPVDGAGIEMMERASLLEIDSVCEMGPDIRVVSYPSRRA